MSKNKFKLIRIAVSCLGLVSCLFIAHVFNPFSLMTFIPKDEVYDVCITVYFSVAEWLIIWGMDSLEEKLSNYYMTIEMVLSSRKEVAELQSKPKIQFNSEGMAELLLTIKLHGDRSFFSNIDVVVPRIVQADYQLGRKSIGARINNNGDFCVRLSDVCGQSKKVDMSEEFLITLQKVPVDDNAIITLAPEIRSTERYKRIKVLSNMAIILLEGR